MNIMTKEEESSDNMLKKVVKKIRGNYQKFKQERIKEKLKKRIKKLAEEFPELNAINPLDRTQIPLAERVRIYHEIKNISWQKAFSVITIIVTLVAVFSVIYFSQVNYDLLTKPKLVLKTDIKNNILYTSKNNSGFMFFITNSGNVPCVNLELMYPEVLNAQFVKDYEYSKIGQSEVHNNSLTVKPQVLIPLSCSEIPCDLGLLEEKQTFAIKFSYNNYYPLSNFQVTVKCFELAESLNFKIK